MSESTFSHIAAQLYRNNLTEILQLMRNVRNRPLCKLWTTQLAIASHTLYPQAHHHEKTRLYNIYPLKPHFYIVKLVFTGVYIIFLISAQKHRLWYSLEPPRRGGSNEYPQSMF